MILLPKEQMSPIECLPLEQKHRLLLRQDNCDERLMPVAHVRGFVEDNVYEERKKIWDSKNKLIKNLIETSISPEEWNEQSSQTITQACKMYDLVKRPEVSIEEVLKHGKFDCESNRFIILSAQWDIKYSGFIHKQNDLIEKIRKLEETKIPEVIDYYQVPGLLTESKTKLNKIKPHTLGQASRISGVTPSDITILALFITKASKVSRETNRMSLYE